MKLIIVRHGQTDEQESHKPANTGVAILEITEGKPVKIHKLNNSEHLN